MTRFFVAFRLRENRIRRTKEHFHSFLKTSFNCNGICVPSTFRWFLSNLFINGLQGAAINVKLYFLLNQEILFFFFDLFDRFLVTLSCSNQRRHVTMSHLRFPMLLKCRIFCFLLSFCGRNRDQDLCSSSKGCLFILSMFRNM